MAQTTAERVQAYRVRQRERIAEMHALASEMGRRLEECRETISRLEDRITELEERQCRHPAQVVQAGTCQACGAETW